MIRKRERPALSQKRPQEIGGALMAETAEGRIPKGWYIGMLEPRSFPTVKRLLFRVHADLAKIAQPADFWGNGKLTEFESIVLLLEDRRFFQHQGIDLRSIGRELFRMLTFQKFGGASTIDMQYVRTRTGYKARTLRRKLYEMLLAYLLQFRMPKIVILRAYLQEVFLGSGLYGIHSAARTIFDKSSYDLSREEAATLAAMMVYPRPLTPSPSWKAKVDKRAAYGLRLFRKYGGRHEQRFK